MNQKNNTVEKIIFGFIYSLCCMLMSSDKLPLVFGCHDSSYYIYYKLVLCFSATFMATISFKNIAEYIGKYVLINNIVVTIMFTFDYYVTEISGSVFLFRVWWIAAITMSALGVFVGMTVNNKELDYQSFFKKFMISVAPLYLVTFFICFMRKPSDNITTNFKLFKGTFDLLPYIINNGAVDFEAPLIFIGNIIIFTPVPIILKGIWSKIKTPYSLLIGFILPLFAEGYQYIFKCGNVDIDDIVMNWAGYGIGLILIFIISNKLLNKTK